LGVVALNPDSHEVLTQADIPDTVLHLILPADEMFYTNQTTKFARYVKHLGARILVYMGLLTKVSNKVNLFDILGRFKWISIHLEMFSLSTLRIKRYADNSGSGVKDEQLQL
jgi:hypothetical protein